MLSRIPEVLPISDLVRDARGVIELARKRHEPVIITQRGRETAVLIPIELYRQLERAQRPHSEDADYYRMEMTEVAEPET
jgi:prevent-host-death family protein